MGGSNKTEKPRRHPLSKERFLEGNRSRFTIIFMIAMFIVMICEIKWRIPAAAYLSFLTFLGSFYLGGATLSAWVAANKSDTVNQNVTTVQTSNTNDTVQVSVKRKNDENINQTLVEQKTVDVNISKYIKEEGVNAPEIKPFSASAFGDEEEGEHHVNN